MDRRDFIRAAALVPLLGGCAAEAMGGTTAMASPPPDWAGLRRKLTGSLVLPGDSGYDRARRLFNPAFDKVRPGGVAYCASPADVSRSLSFARANKVPVTARSGGHSYAGWSTGTGLVIDVSRMSAVSYSGGRATVGAGAKLVDVYDKLSRYGVSIPAGSCPTVGVGGLTLGGGIGVVSRKYGLTCDTLESVQVVTADGRVLTCDADHHAGLYWACRGGGGGNFGVVTSFTFRTHPVRDVSVFFLRWPWAKAAAAVKAWQSWAPKAPDELWSSLHLGRDRNGLYVQIGGLYLGGKSALNRLLGQLDFGTTTSRYVAGSSYQHAMMVMAGCATLSVDRCKQATREVFTAKSHLAYQEMSDKAISTLVAGVARDGRHSVLIDALGGAVGRVRSDATAFPHRAALFSVQYYNEGADRTWLRAIHTSMRPHLGDHAYVNYIDADLTNWREQYYGPNAARLAEVKRTYDPDRVFHLPQGI